MSGLPGQDVWMMCRKKNYEVGDAVTVNSCAGGYPLPPGLPEGAEVRVVWKDIGYDFVEFQGREYTVFMACVESGWETGATLNAKG